MAEKSFKQLQEAVRELSVRFPNKWDEKTHFVNLIEEMGELGNALLIKNGDKSTKRKRAEYEDSFADIFFSFIMMANDCDVDLEKVLTTMLDELKVRIDNDEYEN